MERALRRFISVPGGASSTLAAPQAAEAGRGDYPEIWVLGLETYVGFGGVASR